MTRPGLAKRDVARLLDVSEPLVDALCARRFLPQPAEGVFSPRLVEEARRRHPWMRRLGEPLSERELSHVNPTLFIPHGVGFTQAGERYARLCDVLARLWRVDGGRIPAA